MFALESAIKDWKKRLAANPAMEDGHIAELEAHLRDRIDELTEEGLTAEEAFVKASAALGGADEAGAEFYKVYTTRRSGRPPWQAPRFMPALIWNYIKVAGRLFRRRLGFSLITVGGLAVSLASVIFISLWVRQESGFDRFHDGHECIYRVVLPVNTPEASFFSGSTPGRFAEALVAELPGVEMAARLRFLPRQAFKFRERVQLEDGGAFVDPSFLRIFSFPLVSGERRSALSNPDAMVVCQSFARKFFGTENALNQTVEFMGRPFRVTGVLKDLPADSSLRFDFLCSLKLLESDPFIPVEWYSDNFSTFVRLHEPVQPEKLSDPLNEVIRRHAPMFARLGARFSLQPLDAMHLEENFRFDDIVTGSRTAVTAFSFVAALILLIAVVNFVNLSTVRASTRIKEVGVRKVLGSSRRRLLVQFLTESFGLTALAVTLALLLVGLTLPAANRLFSTALRLDLGRADLWLQLGLALAATALATGTYPALLLSSLPIQGTLPKATHTETGATRFRSALLTMQFAITVFLLIGMGMVQRQLHFMLDRELGFDKENIIVISASRLPEKRYLSLKNEWLRQAGVRSVTAAAGLPFERTDGGPVRFPLQAVDVGPNFEILNVDADFIAFMGLKVKVGRAFSSDRKTDIQETCLVNETAAGILGGPDRFLGKPIQLSNGRPRAIIGVVCDAHLKSLHHLIDPLAIRPLANPLERNDNGVILVKAAGPMTERVLDAVRRVWQRMAPDLPFAYHFLDDEYSRLYETEMRSRSLIAGFSLLSVFITCLGLFGLAAFAAQRRTREIGIRKVMGASNGNIFLLLSKKFGLWVLLANIIAWPVAYFWLSRWLASYPLRVGLDPLVFLLASVATFAIALLAVSLGTVRAARANPVDSLRYE